MTRLRYAFLLAISSFLFVRINALNYRPQLPRGSIFKSIGPNLDTEERAFLSSNRILAEQNEIGMKRAVRWDTTGLKFESLTIDDTIRQSSIKHFLLNCFLPSGELTQDYYKYTAWRLAQRFVSATSSVFGTQALLLALGIAAATTWVLKDALGKISRILWASNHGRKFDSDAKKWRFRSSVLFATGNAFEILTYLVPSMFLFTAAIANALKQMAMLTSSATRNAIYKSFARNSDNIGDITAKGEAQIAVIDLLGMLAGVWVSKAIDTSRTGIAVCFLFLSVLDLLCIFREIKSVVFHSLNFARAKLVLNDMLNQATMVCNDSDSDSDRVDSSNGSDVSDGDRKGLASTWLSTSSTVGVDPDTDASSASGSMVISSTSSKQSADSYSYSTDETTLTSTSRNDTAASSVSSPTVVRWAKARLSNLKASIWPTTSIRDSQISSLTSSWQFRVKELGSLFVRLLVWLRSTLGIRTTKDTTRTGADAATRNRIAGETTIDVAGREPLNNTAASIYPAKLQQQQQLHMDKIKVLNPSQLSLQEPIFLPTQIGETIFKSWTTLDVDPDVLLPCLNMFGHDEKIIVTVKARVVTSWTDAFLADTGLSTGKLLRSVQGVPVLLCPQVLLRVDATHFDIFRSLVVVHKLIHEFNGRSNSTTPTEAGLYLHKVRVLEDAVVAARVMSEQQGQGQQAQIGPVYNTTAVDRVESVSDISQHTNGRKNGKHYGKSKPIHERLVQARASSTMNDHTVTSTSTSTSTDTQETTTRDPEVQDKRLENENSINSDSGSGMFDVGSLSLLVGGEEAVLSSVGLGSDSLVDLVRNAKDFERANIRDVVNSLRSVGWDMAKFMFGDVKTRVEWPQA